MYTLAIAAQKGGTGKSTTCHALGAEFSKAGRSVLLVDADPQGDLSLSVTQEQPQKTLYGVLQGAAKISDAIYNCAYGGIIAPGDRLKEKDPIAGREPEQALKRALEAVKKAYDVCIIDTPPQLGLLTITALTAADGVIVPATADRYSLEQLSEFYRTFSGIRQTTNKTLRLLGVIMTRYNGRVGLYQDILAAMQAQAKVYKTKVYLPPVRATSAVTAWQYGCVSKSTAQQDYAALAAQILKDIKK